MTAFLNPWVILSLVLAIVGAFGGGYYKGNSAGQAEVQQKWDKEKTEQYAAYADAQEEARTREQNLQIQADRIREDKDNEIRNLNARATALSNSLRDRPSRSAPAPSTVSASSDAATDSGWCTGTRLYREHAEAFAGESAIAAEIQSDLRACRQQYEEAVKLLNQHQSKE